jgi:hypothetical protein
MSNVSEGSRITLENEYGTYSISTHSSDMDIVEIFNTLIIPLLKAAGYAEKTVEDYLD